MPKHLLLCRHADTLSAESGQKDFDRQLSSAGKEEARRAASWIKNLALSLEVVYHSAAVRTTQTAQLLAADLEINPTSIFSDAFLYDAPARSWLHKVTALDAYLNTVVLVGHNPGISEVVQLLTQGKLNYVPTGGVTYFAFETTDWQLVEVAKVKWHMNY